MPRASRKSSQTVTIQTVAKHAGVSAMTVSNVLNNRRNVGAAMREQVQRAVQELGYQPNLAARSLASAAVVRLGILTRDIENGFLSAILVGALETASNMGAQLVLRRMDTIDPENLLREARAMRDTGCNILLAPAPYCEIIHAHGLAEQIGMPVIGMSPGEELPGMSTVRIDDFGAAREMTAYLISLGHRRIGFVRSGPGLLIDHSRFNGYRAALDEAGISFDPALVGSGAIPYDWGRAAAEQLLTLTERPTAIFASTDEMAATVISLAHRRGIDVPGQLSVAGFDDNVMATMLHPPLTTVHQPIAAISALATCRAIEALRGGDGEAPAGAAYLDHHIVVRESTGPCPATACG